MEDKKEELGKIVFDGKIYDLDKLSADELKKLIDRLKEEEEKLEKKYEDLLNR